MPETLRVLRRKIKTIGNLEHITSAMQLVAGAKLQKLHRRVAAGAEYAQRLRELLDHVAAAEERSPHPYLTPRPVERVGLVVMAGDRGLCGGFNQQVFALADEVASEIPQPLLVVSVGERATGYARWREWEIIASYPGIGDLNRSGPALDLGRTIRQLYEQGKVDEVHVVYQEYQSMLRHRPQAEQLLPIVAKLDPTRHRREVPYAYEPAAAELLEAALPQALDAILYQMVVGTQAAEQSARMVAMRAATDNATEMITDMTRRLNQARQQHITAEIMDIVGGASAVGAL